jgi:phage regulator Rha-like protein
MDAGDKLFMYEKGKKGALLLVASSEMDGKVQLISKL